MSKAPTRYIERVEIREDDALALSIVGHFEDMAPVVLARVGEGPSEWRSAETLTKTAEALGETLERGHLAGWLESIGAADTVGFTAIDYDEDDPDVRTSYRRMRLTIGGRRLVFDSGDPVTDHVAMIAAARRSCSSVMESSSLNHFARDVAGFRWDGNVLVADPVNTLEAWRARRAVEDEENEKAAPTP